MSKVRSRSAKSLQSKEKHDLTRYIRGSSPLPRTKRKSA
nr:MAG TPA: hypothetical protein [Caudoviricetes sp.]